MTQSTTTMTTRKAPHQYLALVIGAVYLLIGVVGFFITGFDGFTEHNHDQTLLGFAINPLHNIVHIVIGFAGVLMWSRDSSARSFGWLLFVGYGAAAVYGFIVADNPDTNLLNINQADNWLHVASALAGLAIALWPRRDHSRTDDRRTAGTTGSDRTVGPDGSTGTTGTTGTTPGRH